VEPCSTRPPRSASPSSVLARDVLGEPSRLRGVRGQRAARARLLAPLTPLTPLAPPAPALVHRVPRHEPRAALRRAAPLPHAARQRRGAARRRRRAGRRGRGVSLSRGRHGRRRPRAVPASCRIPPRPAARGGARVRVWRRARRRAARRGHARCRRRRLGRGRVGAPPPGRWVQRARACGRRRRPWLLGPARLCRGACRTRRVRLVRGEGRGVST
jgi:hypothetical protein